MDHPLCSSLDDIQFSSLGSNIIYVSVLVSFVFSSTHFCFSVEVFVFDRSDMLFQVFLLYFILLVNNKSRETEPNRMFSQMITDKKCKDIVVSQLVDDRWNTKEISICCGIINLLLINLHAPSLVSIRWNLILAKQNHFFYFRLHLRWESYGCIEFIFQLTGCFLGCQYQITITVNVALFLITTTKNTQSEYFPDTYLVWMGEKLLTVRLAHKVCLMWAKQNN